MSRTIVNPEEVGKVRAPGAPIGGRRRGAGGPVPEPVPPPPVAAPAPDDYKDRVLKYIPAEVVTLYLSVDAIVRAKQDSATLSWGLFVFGVLATILYLRLSAGVTKPLQLVVSALAFCVWAISIGSPSTYIPGYDAIYGAIALPIFTFVAGLIKP
jgi:hypothetical protein